MTISQKIKMALAYKGMSEADLARAVSYRMAQRYKQEKREQPTLNCAVPAFWCIGAWYLGKIQNSPP